MHKLVATMNAIKQYYGVMESVMLHYTPLR